MDISTLPALQLLNPGLGKQTVYHTLQDTSDTSIADALASLGQEQKQLQDELHALTATEKEARAGLAAFEARPRLTGICHDILQLENERDAIQARLAALDGADAVQISLAEREALDQEWKLWQRQAAVRRRICRELWGICSEVLPEGMTAPELWVSTSGLSLSDPSSDQVMWRRSRWGWKGSFNREGIHGSVDTESRGNDY